MKRIFLLIIAVFLLAGCGLSEAAEETTASIGTGNQEAGGETTGLLTDDGTLVLVDGVKCDVHPLAAVRNRASVACLLTVETDSLKLGSDDPVELYLGGTLGVQADDDSLKPFRDDESMTATGKARFNVCKGDVVGKDGLFYPCGLPLALMAQIDGISAPVEIVGAAAVADTSQMTVLRTSESSAATLVDLQCQGELIPGSGLAQIILIGELKDGRNFSGGGLVETGSVAAGNTTPKITGCELEADSVEAYLGGALGDELSTITVQSLNFEEIKVTFKLENGDEKLATVSGFALGLAE